MAITAEDLKKMSPRMKAVLVCVACLLLAYFYYFFYLQTALEKKGNLEKKLTELKQEVVAKQKIASEKDKYIRELKRLKENFQVALTKLPNEKEIPDFLESVSLAGRNSGIEFLLFEPVPIAPIKVDDKKGKDKAGKDKQKTSTGEKEGDGVQGSEQFYTDIPIKVKISGSFQNILEFFDKISKLPRIINVENLTLGDRKESKKKGAQVAGNDIITTCTIKTYMFLDKAKDDGKEKGNDDVKEKQ